MNVCRALPTLALVLLAACSASAVRPKGSGAKFSVLVRSPDRQQEPVSVEEPGALPVEEGGAMVLEVQLDQPAFVYLVWIDSAGRIKPLYPWNNESIEVTDLDEARPVRRATNRIFSPLLGRDWTFEAGSGMETVLLLVNHSPLPKDVKLGELLREMPPGTLSQPAELAVLELGADKTTIKALVAKDRGDETQAKAADEPLAERMRALGKHFDLVQAVKFAHVATKPASLPAQSERGR